MSTYCACIDLARDPVFLNRFKLHFEMKGRKKFCQIPVQYVFFITRTPSLWSITFPNEPVKRPDFTNIIALSLSFKQRWEAKGDLFKNRSPLIHYFNLCRDVEQCRQLLEGGITSELNHLVRSISVDDLVNYGDLGSQKHPVRLEQLENLMTEAAKKKFSELSG